MILRYAECPVNKTSTSSCHVHPQRTAGFTLVELLVVLAIIGMMITAMPTLISAVLPGMKLRAAAYDFASALRAARGTAVLQHQDTIVRLDLRTGQYQVFPGATSWILPEGVSTTFEGPTAEISGNVVAIRFFPDGTSTGGRIGLSAGHSQREIVAHWLTGRISTNE